MNTSKTKSKKILVISPIPTHPQNAGNRTRLYSLLLQIKKLGHQIHFVYSHHKIVNPDTKYKSDFQGMLREWDKLYVVSSTLKIRFSNLMQDIDRQIGLFGIFLKKYFPIVYSILKNIKPKPEKQKPFVPTSIDLLYNTNLDKFLEKLTKKEKFDVAIVEYLFFSKALQAIGKDTLKVLDTHDSFTNRHMPYRDKSFDYRGLSTTTHEEAKALDRADVIVAIQDEEKEFFSKLTNKKIITLGHITHISPPIKRESERKNILFVGTLNYANQDAIHYFTKHAFPKIQSKFPDAKLVLAGKISDAMKEAEWVVKLGELKDLERAYSLADIIVNPLFIGTGLKIKNIEALSHSKPLVTTPLGARGLERGIGKVFLVCETPQEFVESIDKIFSDPKFYDYLSQNAYNFIKEYNEKNLNALKGILNDRVSRG